MLLKQPARGTVTSKATVQNHLRRGILYKKAIGLTVTLPLDRIHVPLNRTYVPLDRNYVPIDPLHKWRPNLSNNTVYILSLVFMFQDKGFFS